MAKPTQYKFNTEAETAELFLNSVDKDVKSKVEAILLVIGKGIRDNTELFKKFTKRYFEANASKPSTNPLKLVEFIINEYEDEELQLMVKDEIKSITKDELHKFNFPDENETKPKSKFKEKIKEPTKKEIEESHKGALIKVTPTKIKIRGTDSQIEGMITQVIQKHCKTFMDQNDMLKRIGHELGATINKSKKQKHDYFNLSIKNGIVNIAGKGSDIINGLIYLTRAVEEKLDVNMRTILKENE